MYLRNFCLVVLICSSLYSKAQNSVSFKFNTLTYQITETQPDLLKLKLSANGQLAIEPGILFSYETYTNSKTAFKFSQILLLDKASHLAGASSFMIKFKVAKSFKHSFYIALGPTFHFRKAWTDMEGYIEEPVYNLADEWQHKISWLSAEIEYNYYLNKKTDLSISLNHIQAESIGVAIGVKYWINKKPRKKRGCVSCPSLH